MSTHSNEVEKGQATGQLTAGSKSFKKILIGAGVAVIVLGLALGLGLGLGLNRANTSSPSPASNTTSTSPTATATGSSPTSTSSGSSWQPAINTTFNYQLGVEPSTNPYGIDVWFIDLFGSSKDLITGLQGNGAKVVCYFSAGSGENWRPDYNQFQPIDLGDDLKGWNGERWLNTSSPTVRAVMKSRLDQAMNKSCDGVDPDNMDAYDNNGGGFNLTTDDATDYAKFLASESSSRGLAIGLKNAAKIIPNVIDVMQWSVNEQCVAMQECASFSAFPQAGKPVFNIEYPKGDDTNNNDAVSTDQVNEICNKQQNNDVGFTTILKNMKLDQWIEFCNGTSTVLS